MPSSPKFLTVLPTQTWQSKVEQHFQEACQFTTEARKRRDRGKPHPVEDFLFQYYPYPIALIEQWHPGLELALEAPDPELLPLHLQGKRYRHEDGLCYLNPSEITEKLQTRLNWIKEMLEATQRHTPNFACHGMHEWAMVYRGEEIRHYGIAPLRLSQEEIDALVESQPIACSHHDAFRFFAKEARPLNRLQPSIHTRHLNEQSACVHANMDLYKWAAKSMPWIGSDLFLDTFKLANQLRDLDMRASPYELSEWGLEPIKIETQEGRKQYETEQRRLATLARELRSQLIERLSAIISV